MSSEPNFTAEEYLDSVLFSKNVNFIIVEGPFDRALYTEAYETLSGLTDLDLSNHEVIFGGGKKSIHDWYNLEEPKNAKCIFDRDFDFGDYNLPDDFYVELERYSIENYFFDSSVFYPQLRLSLSMTNERIEELISLDTLIDNWKLTTFPLMAALYYYQKIYESDNKEGWKVEFLCQNKSYELCQEKIDNMVSALLSEMGVTLADCVVEFEKTNIMEDCVSVNFPGKLLFESFYRYIRNTCKEIKPDSTACMTNSKVFISQLVPRLIKNTNFKDKLLQAV
ncbi:TOPRIM nucleotidyl transferase/hydrolase domain-containing protein [Vibrio sp. F13]|uniref:TOPRIM nucleotidyl transferase/hydrolase domain-containing protein n=1 Tax=Vibrio sp. F13 TaxID=2070777 RepID=UPI0010BE1AC3|nr:TOPRIM nucleotidyl transferase/hydrolase domain-containing protein [Vibrio sp. F13]TKG02409.1 DUF4435 domain-containing protein [Vibrio sp. F13]